MAKKKESKDLIRIGHYAFLAGIIIALIAGLVPQLSGDISVWIMIVLGLIVGLINISATETNSFLIAAASFIIASSAVAVTIGNAIWYGLTGILINMIVFIAPVAIIVSIMAVIRLAEKR